MICGIILKYYDDKVFSQSISSQAYVEEVLDWANMFAHVASA